MSPRPFDPEFLPEGHPDKIAVPSGGSARGRLWRGLVRYVLRPSYRALVALGSMHVAALWHPEFGPQCRPPREEPPGYRTFRAGVERGPEAWPPGRSPSSSPVPPVPPAFPVFPENRGDPR